MPDRRFRLPVWLFVLSVAWLHDLRHKIPHGFRYLVLHLPGGMGVGAEGEPCVVVAGHIADGFHVYAILVRKSGEAEVVEANMLQLCVF